MDTTGSDNTASGSLALGLDTTGSDNTASGFEALLNNTIGIDNTASGFEALLNNTTGSDNTASGFDALANNTTGFQNTADGFEALFNNTSGIWNTAIGSDALYYNATGSDNTALGYGALNGIPFNTNEGGNTGVGFQALFQNGGMNNTAIGAQALTGNDGGSNDTATGVQALRFNNNGIDNTADGEGALQENSMGNLNTASGWMALSLNTTGNNNVAFGDNALGNTTGNNNIAIGSAAGLSLRTGSNNIDIYDSGGFDESNTIRIGTAGTQTATFIAGISGVGVTSGAAVVVNSSGQLGVVPSSARYKRDIHDMGDASDKLMKLRPVAFRYKADPTETQQYGLIAEEVEKVYPELVVNGTDGKPQTVAYHLLPAMLLNELQKQARTNRQLVRENAGLQKEVDALKHAKIDVLTKQNALFAARLDALEEEARATQPERLAATMR
jgi:hypothetical protein